MKKSLVLCMFMVLSLIAVGCFKDGKDGKTGSSGAPGQDALISSNSYPFTPDANPYIEPIAEIDLDGVEAGWQTVTVYAWVIDVWRELPVTEYVGVLTVEHMASIADGAVGVATKEDGVLAGGSAIGGSDCMAIVQTFEH